jgi:hypothetical protein
MTRERLLAGLTSFYEYLVEDGHDKVNLWLLSEAIDWLKASPELSPSPPPPGAIAVRIAVAVDRLASGRTVVEAVGIDDFDDERSAMERLADRIQSSAASKAIVLAHIPRREVPTVVGVVEPPTYAGYLTQARELAGESEDPS